MLTFSSSRKCLNPTTRNKGTDIKYGARPLRRAIQRYVEDELSDLILKSDLKNGQTVNIDRINNELSFVVE